MFCSTMAISVASPARRASSWARRYSAWASSRSPRVRRTFPSTFSEWASDGPCPAASATASAAAAASYAASRSPESSRQRATQRSSEHASGACSAPRSPYSASSYSAAASSRRPSRSAAWARAMTSAISGGASGRDGVITRGSRDAVGGTLAMQERGTRGPYVSSATPPCNVLLSKARGAAPVPDPAPRESAGVPRRRFASAVERDHVARRADVAAAPRGCGVAGEVLHVEPHPPAGHVHRAWAASRGRWRSGRPAGPLRGSTPPSSSPSSDGSRERLGAAQVLRDGRRVLEHQPVRLRTGTPPPSPAPRRR